MARTVRAPGGAVAQPSIDYVRRDPAGSALHGLVRDHFETFRAEAARGPPRASRDRWAD